MAPKPGIAEEIRRFQAQYARNPEGFAFARLADAYRKAGDPERALELLQAGLERHPRYLSAHIVKARVLTDLGRHEDAAVAYRRVLELDPQNLVALGALAGLASERGHLEEAAASYRRLREVDPLDEETRERLAAIERRLAREPGDAADRGPTPEGREPGPGADGGDEAGEPRRPEEPGRPEAIPPERAEEAAPAPAAEAEEPPPPPPERDEEDLVVTATMGDLFLRQELFEQAVRVFERLLARRPGDPFLTEKLETALGLARGRAGRVRAAAGRTRDRRGDGEEREARPGAEPSGGSERPVPVEPGEPTRGPSGPVAPRRAATREAGAPPDRSEAYAPGATRGPETTPEPTVREYLKRLLEGRAGAEPDVGPSRGASRFERWLRRSDEA